MTADRDPGRPVVVEVSASLADPLGRDTQLDLTTQFAVREALLRQVPLWLVNAYQVSGAGPVAHDGRVTPATTTAHRAARSLEHMAARIARQFPDLELAMFANRGSPAAVLADIGTEAGQVVVGGRGAGTLAEALLRLWARDPKGSASANAVVVVPPQVASLMHDAPVVVAMGRREPSTHLLEFAFREAWLRQVPLRFVHCSRTRHDLPGGRRSSRDRWSRLVEALEPYRHAYPSHTMSAEVVDGDPAEVLCKESVTAGLLVIEPRGSVSARSNGPTNRVAWVSGGRPMRPLGPVARDVLRRAAGMVALVWGPPWPLASPRGRVPDPPANLAKDPRRWDARP